MSWTTPQSINVANGTLPTGEDLSSSLGQVGYINSSGNVVLADAGSEDRGALGNDDDGGIITDVVGTYAASGNPQRCSLSRGRVWALAGGTIKRNEKVTGGSTAATLVAADTSGDIPLGTALQEAASGQRFLMDYTGPADEAIA